MERFAPILNHVLGSIASQCGIRELALQVNEQSGQVIPGSAPNVPELVYRDPVALWINSTYATATEPTDKAPEAFVATARIRCNNCEQVLNYLRRLTQGVEVIVDGDALLFTMLTMRNAYAPDMLCPTHQRNASCHMLLQFKGEGVAVMVELEHKEIAARYKQADFDLHYQYFWQRMLNMTQISFDTKFEILLNFLVEAIGVPVLLSLLLLTYSNTTGGDVIDLDDLPEGRLQLYKLGIIAGIRKRLLLNSNSASHAAEAGEKDEKEKKGEAANEDGRPKREKRKGALEQNLGGVASASTSTQHETRHASKHASSEPVLDLNSILRGKKVRVVSGEDEVAEAYSLVVRVLDKTRQPGFDLRTGITAVVPKSHTMHAPVTALVEYVLAPAAQGDAAMLETGKTMLRRVAVDNQENGRREFTSKNVACALGANPEELGLWSRLDLDHDYGVALCATLAKQSDKAPAQYQFKHLSFQEGLYAEHLLLMVTNLAPPNGPGWPGWLNHQEAAKFLNNRYMNNTCRIAAGHLGALLAGQRADWDFREAPLTPNGRSALWFITDENDKVRSINVANNEVDSEDVGGIAKMLATCPNLQSLDLSDNDLVKLTIEHSKWSRVCEALGTNNTLTDLNLNNNKLGPTGVRIASKALLGCSRLQRLGFSYNEPGVEPSLADLLRAHPSLTSIELVESLDRHLPSRAKDDLGRALAENKARTLGFLHCDVFVLSDQTRSLTWPKEASTSDAVLLAGVLSTNTTLTTFNIAAGATLENKARSALGEALLNNPNSGVAFCNDFGLAAGVDTCEFDLSRVELKDVEPFRLLAGTLRGNRTLTHVTLIQLRMEQISTLALALRGNSTLAQLDIIHQSRMGGQSLVRLPVPELNGSKVQAATTEGATSDPTRVDLSATCLEGQLGRVACAMIGTLIASNTQLQRIDISNTGLGVAIGAEGEGGHILLRPMCESKQCPLQAINLSNVQLNDKAGAKLMTALSVGLGKGDAGYEKIVSLNLSKNELGKGFTSALKQMLWGERAPCMLASLDLSDNPTLDGYETALALKRNESLTEINIQGIPSANADDIYSFIGNFLLQDDCMCRLGFLSCDAFHVSQGQTELDLDLSKRTLEETEEAMAARAKAAAANSGQASTSPVILLLAGVVKFNSSLRTLKLTDTGLDTTAAGYFATAMQVNQALEHLDLSGNPIGAQGIAEIAEATRAHPSLVSMKVDGAALPLAQIRGAKGAEPSLDLADWGLRELSGHAIGTFAKNNRSLLSVNLKANPLGALGLTAVVNGLGDAPLKAIDMTRTGLGGEDNELINQLSVAVCQHIGSVVDLRIDENELDCPANALAPLCKLRSLRLLSLEKNRLTSVPALIGTMLSLRRISLHSNQLTDLPSSLCLLVSLESFDVHKNMLTSLPQNIGNLKNLQKLDLSENRLAELPVTICELSETLQFSVGRNPLEKPSVEQARQGIGAIRRFFGFSRGRQADEVEEEATASNGAEEQKALSEDKRPKRDVDEEGLPLGPSRHDWAGPAGVILLFNCANCTATVADGSSDLTTIPPDEVIELTAGFNLQVVGKVREAKSMSEEFADRIQWANEWLPWRTQDVVPTETPVLTIQLKWKGKSSATLLVRPWIAYGCAVGSRIKMLSTGRMTTIVNILPDDTCEVVADNDPTEHREMVDPRPDTVTRTMSPAYKGGQKLLLLHEGEAVDAVVDEWLGVRHGSRHRVRLAAKADAKHKAHHKKGGQVMLEVDLNEANHTKLMFPTVARYEDARLKYLEAVSLGRHSLVMDDMTSKTLRAADQRVYTKTHHVIRVVEAPAEAPASDAPSAASREGSPAGQRSSSPPPAPQSTPPAPEVATPPPPIPEEPARNMLETLQIYTSAKSSAIGPHPATMIRCKTKAEVDMVHNQTIFTLAAKLRESGRESRLVPISLSMQRLTEMMADESKKLAARDMIIKAFEADYAGHAEVLKQAIELRALIFIAEVKDEAEFLAIKEGVLEELQANRLIVTCCGVSPNTELPMAIRDDCQDTVVSSLGLFMSESRLANRQCKDLLRRLKLAGEQTGPDVLPTHYSLVRQLHLGGSDMGREALAELQEYLVLPSCHITTLDLSYSQLDAFPLIQALRGNSSLTSLDVRMVVPRIGKMYQTISEVLLAPQCRCCLSYLRCDAFEVLEGDKTLSLREQPLESGAVRLVAGVLRHNRTIQDVDLTATDLESEGAIALASILEFNTSLSAFRMLYNPAIDDEAKTALRQAVKKWRPELRLDL